MTTTTTRKVAKAATPKAAPTITRTPDGGLLLTGLPFMVDGIGADGAPGRSSRLMGGRGLGWTWMDNFGVKGWTHAAAPGVIAECVDTLAGYGVTVLDMSGKGAAPVAPGKVTRPKAAPAPKTAPAPKASRTDAFPIMTNAEVVAYANRSSLASKITAALAADGVAPEIIAAAIAAATAKADEIAKSVSATVSAPAKSSRVKAARTVKAATVKPAKLREGAKSKILNDLEAGTRAIVLPDGTDAKEAALAIRRAFGPAGIQGVSISLKQARENKLIAFRADGARVSADVDAVMIAAVASLA